MGLLGSGAGVLLSPVAGRAILLLDECSALTEVHSGFIDSYVLYNRPLLLRHTISDPSPNFQSDSNVLLMSPVTFRGTSASPSTLRTTSHKIRWNHTGQSHFDWSGRGNEVGPDANKTDYALNQIVMRAMVYPVTGPNFESPSRKDTQHVRILGEYICRA